jgi:transcriptional regulator with XRE-family HTH domain
MRGERIRYVREQMNISQQDLADRIGLHAQQIYKIENGKADPTSDTLLKIAKGLDVSADYLLGLTDEYKETFESASLSAIEKNLLSAFRRGDWREALQILSSTKEH